MNGQKKYSRDEVDKMYGYDQNISQYETTQPIQQTYARQESIKIREKQDLKPRCLSLIQT